VATVGAGSGAAQLRTPAWWGGFGRLWTAAVLSRFGDALRTAALPLIAVQLTDDPLVIASVTACGYLPWLLFGARGMVWNGNQATLVQQHSPRAVLGRIAAAFRTASTSGAPLGALLGGAIAGLFGPAMLAAALFVLAVGCLIPARMPDVPVVEPDDAPTTGRVAH
jgi:hypothetical protein